MILEKNEFVNVVAVGTSGFPSGTPRAVSSAEEVIELAICEMDVSSGVVRSRTHYLIEPKKQRLAPSIGERLGITEDMLRQRGVQLETVLEMLTRVHQSFRRPFVYWGVEDRLALKVAIEGLPPVMNGVPERRSFEEYVGWQQLDLRLVYSLVCETSGSVSLPDATKRLGMNYKGNAHSAYDVAVNASAVLSLLLDRLRRTCGEGKR